MGNHVAIDYETFYSKKLKYSLTTSIAETYVKHHLFDPYMLAVHDATQSWVGHPRDFNWAALEGRDVVAHNSYFEQNVTSELIARGLIPKFTPKSWSCTANLTAYLCNRRPLDGAVEHLYGVKLDKSARKDAAERHWPQDFPEAEQKAMFQYAARDAQYCWQLFEDFGPKWPTVEQRLSRMTIEQGIRGVQINRDLLNDYIVKTHEMKLNTEGVIPWIKDADDDSWEDFSTKPTSTKCIAEQCRRDGIPCPPVKSEDEEAFDLWEATYSVTRPWVKALSAWRSINKLYRTFLLMKERLRDDGTMPFALLYAGAHTLRWTGTARINFQNFRKKPIFCNEHGLMETDWKREDAAVIFKSEQGHWPEWVRYAIDIRHLIIPRPGKKMIVSDLSQIEPRVLAWLTGDTATLDMIRGGMAIYEAHARATMGWKGGNLKKENPALYALAKVRVLGLGYGAGFEKFITIAQTMAGLDLTEDDPEFISVRDPLTGAEKQVSGWGQNSKRIVKAFRDDNPRTTGLWKTLDESMKRSVGADFVMTLPNGRQMRYEKVRGERRIELDPETKLPRSKSVYTVAIGHKRALTYGGKLFENLVQGTARDVMGEHLVRLEDAGHKVLFSVHDEAVLECDVSVTAKEIEQEMSFCPAWLDGCPVSAEAQEVEHYCK